MLSNLGDSDTRLEGFAVGVADYWIKGLSLAELQRRVERLMADIELTTDPG
jgi:DNA-binding response OmpR family regulator